MDSADLNSSILLLQPVDLAGILDYKDLVPPSRHIQPPITGKAFPDFVQYGEINRDAKCTLDEIKAHFLAAAHTTVPRALGIFIDRSCSMNRATIEPCVDEFKDWYKQWSEHQIGYEGCMVEIMIDQERWIHEALEALKVADAACP